MRAPRILILSIQLGLLQYLTDCHYRVGAAFPRAIRYYTVIRPCNISTKNPARDTTKRRRLVCLEKVFGCIYPAGTSCRDVTESRLRHSYDGAVSVTTGNEYSGAGPYRCHSAVDWFSSRCLRPVPGGVADTIWFDIRSLWSQTGHLFWLAFTRCR